MVLKSRMNILFWIIVKITNDFSGVGGRYFPAAFNDAAFFVIRVTDRNQHSSLENHMNQGSRH